MARRNRRFRRKASTGFPLWAGFTLALLSYLLLSGLEAASQPDLSVERPGLDVPVQQFIHSISSVAKYLLPLFFLYATLVSQLRCLRRSRLFQLASKGIDAGKSASDTLSSVSWQQFELLIGEAFRKRGYRVVETGTAGADGGIDLVLDKDGKKTIVQCKHWKAYKVGPEIIRAHFGVMIDQDADYGIVVTSGYFTDAAKEFAQKHGIELIDGKALKSLLSLKGFREHGAVLGSTVVDGLASTAKFYFISQATAWLFAVALLFGSLYVLISVVPGLFMKMATDFSSSLIGDKPDPDKSDSQRAVLVDKSPVIERVPVISRNESGPDLPESETESLPKQKPSIRDVEVERLVNEFEQTYEPPAHCVNFQGWDHMVECTNHRAQARNNYLEQAGYQPKNLFDNVTIQGRQIPEGCLVWNDDQHMVECVNDRIRARRAE